MRDPSMWIPQPRSRVVHHEYEISDDNMLHLACVWQCLHCKYGRYSASHFSQKSWTRCCTCLWEVIRTSREDKSMIGLLIEVSWSCSNEYGEMAAQYSMSVLTAVKGLALRIRWVPASVVRRVSTESQSFCGLFGRANKMDHILHIICSQAPTWVLASEVLKYHWNRLLRKCHLYRCCSMRVYIRWIALSTPRKLLPLSE